MYLTKEGTVKSPSVALGHVSSFPLSLEVPPEVAIKLSSRRIHCSRTVPRRRVRPRGQREGADGGRGRRRGYLGARGRPRDVHCLPRVASRLSREPRPPVARDVPRAEGGVCGWSVEEGSCCGSPRRAEGARWGTTIGLGARVLPL